MAVPKRRSSKSRIRSRQRSHKISLPAARPCANCGQLGLAHRVCPACGYYGQRQVLSIKAE